MSKPIRSLLLAFFTCFCFAQTSFAAEDQQKPANLGGEALWGGLFWAGASEYQGDPAAEEPLGGVLEILRANEATKQAHYALLGVDRVELPSEWFTWVRFSEEFFLRVERSGKGEAGELIVDVQFWQGEQLLSATNVTLLEARPLIIRGPNWRGGYLIAVLALDAGPEKK